MITGAIPSTIVGLELGADDYISKPFHPRSAGTRAFGAQTIPGGASPSSGGARANKVFRFQLGSWIATSESCDRRRETLSQLTTAEFELLAILVQRPNRVLSRDTLLDLLKGQDWAAYDRIIDTQVARLTEED